MGFIGKKTQAKDMTRQDNIRPSVEKTEKSIDQIKEEIDNHIKEIDQSKKEIEKLTELIIEELMKIKELKQKIEELEQEGEEEKTYTKKILRAKPGVRSEGRKRRKQDEKRKVALDYELVNMKMIKKILDLSDNFKYEKDKQKLTAIRKKVRFRLKRKKILGLKDQVKNGRKKILIVEDDPITVNILSYILSAHNYWICSSLNAEDGLKITLKERPDLIILDIMLPGMDGFQLLSILKENEETSHIPVVITSSLTGEKDILRGLEIGATDYIIKPFSPQILFLKVKKILGSKNENIAYNHRL